MNDDRIIANLLATLHDGMKPTENVWRATMRGEAARAAGHWIAVTPTAAQEIRTRGKARGATPVFRIRLATQPAGSNREMVEWIDDVGDTDLVFESNGIEVAIDPVSLRYLSGLTLDVVSETFRLDRLGGANDAG